MKKLIFFSALLLAFTAWQSCDKVKFPKENGSTGPTGPTGPVRKVLLEDYTGTSCGNCPPAGVVAGQLESQYGSKLVAITIHAGFLAVPANPPLDYDFRTAVGTDYHNTFGVFQYPTGMVNRIGYPSTSHLLPYTTWATNIANIINTPPVADIEITNAYNSGTRLLDVSLKSKFMSTLTGYYKLVVLLVEDSVQKPQKDDNLPPTYIDNNYYHRHILRSSINGNSTGWGDTLFTGTVNAGDSITKSYFSFPVPATYGNWNVIDNHCYVVAFIYDAETSSATHYEVIQAEEKKIK